MQITITWTEVTRYRATIEVTDGANEHMTLKEAEGALADGAPGGSEMLWGEICELEVEPTAPR